MLANDISNIHSKFTGANTFFAQVIFKKNEKNSHFMGGKLVKTKEIFLNGQIQGFSKKERFLKQERVLNQRSGRNLKKTFFEISNISD